jgi:hypothetical protein
LARAAARSVLTYAHACSLTIWFAWGPRWIFVGSHVVATQKITLINNVASWPQLYAFGGDGMALTRCSRVL